MKPTERFSDRVSNYLDYRPSYPITLIDTLSQECGLTSESVIADIGSGTGKLTELLLIKDFSVFGVEPNQEMREAAEDLFRDHLKFTSINGESTKTTLSDNTVDLVTAAQAFHWFEPVQTKREFQRVLKPDGHLALIWNKRNTEIEFQKDYENLLKRYCPEYNKVHHHNITDQDIVDFSQPSSVQIFSFPTRRHSIYLDSSAECVHRRIHQLKVRQTMVSLSMQQHSCLRNSKNREWWRWTTKQNSTLRQNSRITLTIRCSINEYRF